MTRLGVDILVPGLFSIEEPPDHDEPVATASWPLPFVGDDIDDVDNLWSAAGTGAAELSLRASSAA